jgi:MoaA/NifB/PqqE/SkfB family radical SAM enzyme
MMPGVRVLLRRRRRISSEDEPIRSACLAPRGQLYFRPDGDVRVCCRNENPLGNVGRDRLVDIWHNPLRLGIRDALDADDYGAGCQHCGAEVSVEGRAGSYPEQFDQLPVRGAEGDRWPRHMEFTLSINCNLQCIQCNGDASSAIRTHRERRPLLRKVYGEEFFEDLREFLPHLSTASFSGGEPFLAEENYRVWQLIAEVAPDLPVTVVTNATQWTPRVQEALSRIRCSFRFSIDGATAATYDSIRVGASFDSVMENVGRYLAYTRERGTSAAVNHCLMPQNVHEFPELLTWADSLGLPVHVSVVRDDSRIGGEDPGFSIVRRSPEDIAAMHRLLSERADEMEGTLQLNLQTWRAELARLGSWSKLTSDELRRLWGVSGTTVLMFTCQGDGPTDDRVARAELEAETSAPVHTLAWGREETIVEASESFSTVLGAHAAERLRGLSPLGWRSMFESSLGPLLDYRILSEAPDRIEATATFERATARVSMVPVRDSSGWAETAHQMFSFLP